MRWQRCVHSRNCQVSFETPKIARFLVKKGPLLVGFFSKRDPVVSETTHCCTPNARRVPQLLGPFCKRTLFWQGSFPQKIWSETISTHRCTPNVRRLPKSLGLFWERDLFWQNSFAKEIWMFGRTTHQCTPHWCRLPKSLGLFWERALHLAGFVFKRDDREGSRLCWSWRKSNVCEGSLVCVKEV